MRSPASLRLHAMPPFSPERWWCSALLDEALALSGDRRAGWIASIGAHDPALAAELVALLTEDRSPQGLRLSRVRPSLARRVGCRPVLPLISHSHLRVVRPHLRTMTGLTLRIRFTGEGNTMKLKLLLLTTLALFTPLNASAQEACVPFGTAGEQVCYSGVFPAIPPSSSSGSLLTPCHGVRESDDAALDLQDRGPASTSPAPPSSTRGCSPPARRRR